MTKHKLELTEVQTYSTLEEMMYPNGHDYFVEDCLKDGLLEVKICPDCGEEYHHVVQEDHNGRKPKRK